MTTLDNYNICYNKNINNLFDNIENRVQILEKLLNQLDKIKHIEFNYHKISAINETLLNENEQLKDEIKQLKENDIKQKDEIKQLKIKINKLEDDKFKNKIFEAITDIINCDSLDTKLINCDDLIKIKTIRNSNSHYIKNIDSIDVKNKKKQKILSILQSLSTEYKEDMIYDYDWNNNIIDEIINYYQSYTFIINSNNINKKDLDRINNWWE